MLDVEISAICHYEHLTRGFFLRIVQPVAFLLPLRSSLHKTATKIVIMPRFTDNWVLDKSMFDYVQGGSCAVSSLMCTFAVDDVIINLCTSRYTPMCIRPFSSSITPLTLSLPQTVLRLPPHLQHRRPRRPHPIHVRSRNRRGKPRNRRGKNVTLA